MGGAGSGRWYRWNAQPTLENYRCLDINLMSQEGAIKEGALVKGQWVWSDVETDEESSSIGYNSNTKDENNLYLKVSYTLTDSRLKFDYKIRLSTSKPYYGGKRYWFLCPVTEKRVSKLYLIPSDGHFVSRHVYKILYASQMKGELDRAIDKKWKIISKTDGHTYPIRPKGMHHKTFNKILKTFLEQESSCARMLIERFKF